MDRLRDYLAEYFADRQARLRGGGGEIKSDQLAMYSAIFAHTDVEALVADPRTPASLILEMAICLADHGDWAGITELRKKARGGVMTPSALIRLMRCILTVGHCDHETIFRERSGWYRKMDLTDLPEYVETNGLVEYLQEDARDYDRCIYTLAQFSRPVQLAEVVRLFGRRGDSTMISAIRLEIAEIRAGMRRPINLREPHYLSLSKSDTERYCCGMDACLQILEGGPKNAATE